MFDFIFLRQAFEDPFYYCAVVLSIVISITLHELAHGWAAIRLGDETPIRQGRMTGNPLVHMGPFSLIAVAVFGLAWGQMPIDPTRLRGRHGEALVAAAGPAMNLALAAITLAAFIVLVRVWDPATLSLYEHPLQAVLAGIVSDDISPLQNNALRLLAIAGVFNLLLLAFNLLPAFPLDGSHILGSYLPKYRDFYSDPANQGAVWLGFILAFSAAGLLLKPVMEGTAVVTSALIGAG